jgi:multidrug efflux pump subunit AcrB
VTLMPQTVDATVDAVATQGGLLISMALSLIVTPAVYYYLARE